jgi:tRNA(fMet)-specific endonuclease VapC
VTLAFMLDTDTVSFAMRGAGNVGARILAHPPSTLCISSLTLAELEYGVARRASRRLRRIVDDFVAAMNVADFGGSAAAAYGHVAADLERRGARIGGFDALIAGHAIAAGLTLVTRNARHFGRVRGLKTEDWYA